MACHGLYRPSTPLSSVCRVFSHRLALCGCGRCVLCLLLMIMVRQVNHDYSANHVLSEGSMTCVFAFFVLAVLTVCAPSLCLLAPHSNPPSHSGAVRGIQRRMILMLMQPLHRCFAL